MGWRTREAFPADCDRLALIGATTFLETFAGVLDGEAIVAHCLREHSDAAYERYLEMGACAWLAEAAPGGAPVGFALLGSTDLPGSDPGGSDIELKRIYTLSRFHGSGAGAELMACATRRAVEMRAARLLLGVYAGNERARAFYARHGFVHLGDRQFRVGDRDYDDIVLAKPLT